MRSKKRSKRSKNGSKDQKTDQIKNCGSKNESKDQKADQFKNGGSKNGSKSGSTGSQKKIKRSQKRINSKIVVQKTDQCKN